jgi:predicted P-loop ATPase
MQVGNAWIIELAELDSMGRADISAVKAFIWRLG